MHIEVGMAELQEHCSKNHQPHHILRHAMSGLHATVLPSSFFGVSVYSKAVYRPSAPWRQNHLCSFHLCLMQ